MGENKPKISLGIRLKNKLKKIIGRDTKEDKDKKLSEGGSMPQASSNQASAVPAPSGEQKGVPRELIGRYKLLSRACEGKKTEEGTLINNVNMSSLGEEAKSCKNVRKLFAHAMVAFLKKFNPDEKIIIDFEKRITDEVINNDDSYTKLVNEILDIISKKYKEVPQDVIDRYEFVLKSLEDKSINLQSLEKEVGNCKSKREQFARAMVVLLKKFKPNEEIITGFESSITDEVINDDGSYRKLIKDILDPITPKKSILDQNEKYKDVPEDIRGKFSKLAEKASIPGNQVHIESLVNSAIVIFKLKMKDNNVKLFAYAMLEFLREVNERYKKSGADEHAYETFKGELGKLKKKDKGEYIEKAGKILDSIDALLQRASSKEVPKKSVDLYRNLYEVYKSCEPKGDFKKKPYKLENPDQVIKASKQNSKRKHFVNVLTNFLGQVFPIKKASFLIEMEKIGEDNDDAYNGLVEEIIQWIKKNISADPNNSSSLSSPEGYETQPESAPNRLGSDEVLGRLDGSFVKSLGVDDKVFNEEVTNSGDFLADLYTSDYDKLVKEFLVKKKDGRTAADLKAELKGKAEDKLKKSYEAELLKGEAKNKAVLIQTQKRDRSKKLIMYEFLELMNCLGANEGEIEDFRKRINETIDGDLMKEIRKSTEDLVDKYSANPSPLNTAMNQPSQSKLPPPPPSIATSQTQPPAPQSPPAGSRPSMPPPLPLRKIVTKKTDSETLPPPPPPYPAPTQQEGLKAADLKDFEKDLKSIIAEANRKCLFYNGYRYDDNVEVNGNMSIDDNAYCIAKVLKNAEKFLSKISEEIHEVEELAKSAKGVVTEQYNEVIKNKGVMTTEGKKREIIDNIKNIVEKASTAVVLKKEEIICAGSNRLEALVKKYNKVTGEECGTEIKKDSTVFDLVRSVNGFWKGTVKTKLESTNSKRADNLDGTMEKIDDGLRNGTPDFTTTKRLKSIEEGLDQEFNIIGRVILYLEKRKNKENEKGFFGKLFGKSKKSKGKSEGSEDQKNKEKFKEDKKQKKEKLNNQKRLKKCFEDMGKYFVKHKGEKVKLLDFKKLVKCKNSYSGWNEKLSNVLEDNTVVNYIAGEKNGKMLLMSILFFSFVKFDDENDIIAACDGLKAGGIKSTDADSFEGKATSIRKAIKGKCATLNMVGDPKAKTNLKDDIKSLCMKYFSLDSNKLSPIENQFK